MLYFQGSREHRPPGEGSLWHAQALNTHTISGSPTTTEISTTWNRYSTELLDSTTGTYTRMTNIMGGSRGGDRGSGPPPGKSEIISLSIKRISFLYLFISCTFRRVLSIISEGYPSSNFRRCFNAKVIYFLQYITLLLL